MNILELVMEEMLTDEDSRRQDEKLLRLYEESNNKEKVAIDDAFTCLCGYRLCTLIKKLEEV